MAGIEVNVFLETSYLIQAGNEWNGGTSTGRSVFLNGLVSGQN